ncbi:MAG: KpsF/GutQ family protein [Gemmatimonadetes bacterium]|jgi:arabinose-5-phosphate isomerase|nr:KpsF/GutQ family protein [Gemmatimonadota bacterium]
MTPEQIIERGRRVVRLEREALATVEERLDASFARAVALIAEATGRVIVAGVGKSGLIGRKIAATLTSTGTPAYFLHPVESAHGDLGIVGTGDVAILLSKSGESDEMLVLLEQLQGLGVRTIAIAGERTSALSRLCDVALDAWVREEACPHDLAPTTSTTAALALGDALAVALLEHKGFRREDFARLHPGGALGRRLITRVDEVMLGDPLPILPPAATVRQAVVVLAEQRGIALVVDDARKLLGLLTAGDLTRLMEHDANVLAQPVEQIMTRAPRTAQAGELASAVAFRMETHGIMAMPVLHDDGRVAGVVHLHDLLRARVA